MGCQKKIALDWQEELVEAVQQGETVEEVAEATESLPSGGLDERTIARLVRGWNERLIQLEAGVWSRLLEWVPPMHLSFALLRYGACYATHGKRYESESPLFETFRFFTG